MEDSDIIGFGEEYDATMVKMNNLTSSNIV